MGGQAAAVDRRCGVGCDAEAQHDHDEACGVAGADHHEHEVGRANQRGGVPRRDGERGGLGNGAENLHKRNGHEEANEDGDEQGAAGRVRGQVGSLTSARVRSVYQARTKSEAKLQKLTVNPIKLAP